MSRRYEELSGPEILDRITPSSTLLLPIGAVEQHGPHLPLAVDILAVAELEVGDAIDQFQRSITVLLAEQGRLPLLPMPKLLTVQLIQELVEEYQLP